MKIGAIFALIALTAICGPGASVQAQDCRTVRVNLRAWLHASHASNALTARGIRFLK